MLQLRSVWFLILSCLFTVGNAQFFHVLFAIFAGEELTENGIIWGEYEKKTLRTTVLQHARLKFHPPNKDNIYAWKSHYRQRVFVLSIN